MKSRSPLPGRSDSDQGAPVVPLFFPSKSGSSPSPLVFRSSTPQRASSNPRSSSAKKVALARAIHDAQNHRSQSTSRAASTGRRRVRRYENDNLLNTFRFLNDKAGGKEHKEGDVPGLTDMFKSFGVHVDWRSCFKPLFLAENKDLLESFRKCELGTAPPTTSSRRRNGENPQSNSKRRIKESPWAKAEEAWMKVEKRLRQTVLRTLGSLYYCLFVQALESVLQFFCEKRAAPPSAIIPQAMSEMLESPISVTSVASEEDVPQLTIALKDSPFHRLLLHATCQFYGLKSQSYNVKGKRVTRVSLPRRMAAVSESGTLSLVGYVRHLLTDEPSTSEAVDSSDIIPVASTSPESTPLPTSDSSSSASESTPEESTEPQTADDDEYVLV